MHRIGVRPEPPAPAAPLRPVRVVGVRAGGGGWDAAGAGGEGRGAAGAGGWGAAGAGGWGVVAACRASMSRCSGVLRWLCGWCLSWRHIRLAMAAILALTRAPVSGSMAPCMQTIPSRSRRTAGNV